jgi:aerobic carbon-monoxide dehydrogenase medium subunit
MSGGARYVEPLTVSEAVAALAENSGARCLAGGQTLVAMMNAGLIEPPLVVGLRRVAELKGIEFDATGSVAIGAMTTHAALAREVKLSSGHAVLREAAVTIAHPAIRNMGTLGGALSHADPNADYPPAVMAADAVIEVVGPAGWRTIPASDFFLDFLTAAIEPGEIVTKVRVPAPARGSVGVYEKFARVDGDYATASIAMVLAMAGAKCSSIRVAIGACGPTPVRSLDAERVMIGTELDAEILVRAGQIMAESIDPVDDVRGSAEYRRMLVPRLLSRAVQRALSALRVEQ